MDILVIVSVFVLSLIFLIGELFSGTIKLGVLSLVFTLLGTALTFYIFGLDASIWSFIAATTINLIAVGYGIRSKTWEKFSQKNISEGKHDDKESERKKLLYPSQLGKTISALRPVGKASFEDEIFEVRSVEGKFIEAGANIEIVKIQLPTIWVKESNIKALEKGK